MGHLQHDRGAAFTLGSAVVVSQIEAILTERSVFVSEGSAQDIEGRVGGSFHPATFAALSAFVAANSPIQIVLPAFPAKSANAEKTISHLPDLGEYLGLAYLNDLCRRIGAVYPPGAHCVICSDGLVFNDLVGVTDDDVADYGLSLRGIIEREAFSCLSDFSLNDYYQTNSVDVMRARLLKDFAVSIPTLKEQILGNTDRRSTFNGIHRFLFEDLLVFNSNWSRNRTRNTAKLHAYEVIRRSDGWSQLVAARFPGAVRLSIHPHTVSAAKLGVKLVDGGGPWATPWHNSVIEMDGRFQLIKRKEAEERGATIAYVGGRYAYYEL